MEQNRYRVLEVSVSGQFQSIGIAKKSDADTEYFSKLFRYFSDTLHPCVL